MFDTHSHTHPRYNAKDDSGKAFWVSSIAYMISMLCCAVLKQHLASDPNHTIPGNKNNNGDCDG